MKRIILILLCFYNLHAISQKTSVCHYYGENSKYTQNDICDYLSFVSNYEAEKTIDKILMQVGLKRNFIIMECPNINNALAVNLPSEFGVIRYIIYDYKFFENVKSSSKTDWSAISILAHEVGHHLNGHTLDGFGSRHAKELEADEFSGFVLAKLGATLEEAKSAINSLVSEQASITHPGRLERIQAVELGFNSAKNIELTTLENYTINVNEIRHTSANSKINKYSDVKIRIDNLIKECQSELDKKSNLTNIKLNNNLASDLYKLISSVSNDLTNSERIEYISDLKLFESQVYNFGQFCFYEQNYDKAFEHFRASLDISQIISEYSGKSSFSDKSKSDDKIFYTAMAANFSSIYKNESIIYFEALAHNDYNHSMVFDALFNHYSEKDPTKAFIYLEKGKRLFPTDNGLLVAEINYYIKKADYNMLLTKLNSFIKKEPNNISLYIALSNVYQELLAQGKVGEQQSMDLSYNILNQAYLKSPQNFEVQYNLGVIYYNKAVRLMKQLNSLSGVHSPSANKNWQLLKIDMDNCFKKALPYFLSAEKINSSDRNTITALYEIYSRLNDNSKSMYYINKLSKME